MTPTPPPLQTGDALLLDFDGTIVEFAPRPDLVSVPPRLPQTLRALQTELNGALAIVTGRRFLDVQAYLHPLVLPGAGQHGAEFCPAGESPRGIANSPRVHEAAAALGKRFDGASGVLVEDKGLSVSLHFRSAPGREPDCESAARIVATQFGLSTLRGKQVIELRASPVTKGDGIRALMELPAFRGRRPVFLGDDNTDEYGFRAVDALGGVGVKVGGEASEARYALASVNAVHGWLEHSLQALRVHALP
jgi:trehalose 6-phosphate phosphatase